jgi:PAS domain S-box-containing protein
MRTREDLRRRIFPLFPQACGAAAAGLGCTVLFGWLSGQPLLASFGANLIPTAPSTALLCVLLGLSILFRSRFPLKRGVAFLGTALGSLSVVAALLLFYASSSRIYSSVELLGISISGTLDGVPIGHMSPLAALICALTALSFLGTLSSSAERRGRAIAAFVFACILTLISTALVLAYLLGTPLLYGGAFIPPAFPTSLCSLFLALAVLTLANLQIWPSSTTDETGVARSLHASILIFVLLSSGILVTGYVYHRHFEREYRAEIENVLASISELKVSELQHWREERLGGAAQFYGNTTFSGLVESFLRVPEAVDARMGILTWFRQVREADQYDRLSLYDAASVERLSYPNGLQPADSLFLRQAATALRSREIVFRDFYRDEHTGHVYLSILIPIFDNRNINRLIGIVALRMDPDTYVYPLLKRWPTPSRTAESLLLRKDGNAALFLNGLKFNNDAALKLRIPLDSTGVPAVMAALGQVGIVEGRDYRGVPVIADVRAVPDSPWFLVARIDLSEVYAPLNERLWITVFFMCAMLIGAGTGVGLLWREQKARFYRDHYLAGRERAWLHDVIARSLNEIYVFDPRTLQFKFANAGAQHNIGYTTQELAGLTALDIKPEYTEQSLRAVVHPLLTGRDKVLVFETEHRRKDGTRYPVESHLQLIERPEGAVILAIVNDITERKRTEKAKRESERLLQDIIDNSTSLIYILDTGGRFVLVNRKAESVLGVSREQLIGKTRDAFLPQEIAAAHRNTDGEVLRAGTSMTFEEENLESDGTHTYLTVKFPLTNVEKSGYAVCGMSTDITERKKAEDLLNRYANRLAVINRLDRVISSTFDIEEVYDTLVSEMHSLFQFDRTSLITLNEDGTEWQIVTQWTSGEPALKPKTWRRVEGSVIDWLVRNKRTLVEEHIGEQGAWAETELLKREGIASRVLLPLIVRGNLIGAMTLASKNPKSYNTGDVGILESLADQIGISMHNAVMYNKVEQHAATLEKRVEERTGQLEAANKELEAFSYSVSHDLRAPLRSIDGFSQIISEEYSDKFDAEGKRLLNIIRSNTQKMGELITDLLDLSRVARDEMKTVRIDMSTLADSIFHEVALPDAQKQYSFSIETLPDAYGDPSLMRQVWRNLISNAIKFTAPKDVRRIEIGARSEHGKTIYFIRDSGVGFDPQYTHKLFGVFQRLHKMEEFEGTGIGLAIVQRIVHRHGGRVWAEGSIGGGATFYFSLPSGESNREQQQ